MHNIIRGGLVILDLVPMLRIIKSRYDFSDSPCMCLRKDITSNVLVHVWNLIFSPFNVDSGYANNVCTL